MISLIVLYFYMDLFLIVILFDPHDKPNSVPQKAFVEYQGRTAADVKDKRAQCSGVCGSAARQAELPRFRRKNDTPHSEVTSSVKQIT